MDKDELAKQIVEDSKDYAEEQSFKLNPDQEMVWFVARGLAENQRNLGARFCPCRPLVGEKREDSICPCKWHKEELETEGKCHCGLFVKV